jgi:prepilin-type N-terminal cleavage/methylation domain-containing protein
MQTANRKSGYTLIELLVGLTIIAIVFSIGFAGYRDFSRRQAVAGVTKSIQSDLRNAQQLALTGQKPTVDYLNNPVTCTRLSGYSFSRISAINYQIRAHCDNVALPIAVKDIVLSSDLSLSAGSVKFKVLGQGTDLPDSLIFTVTHTAGTTGTITVGIGGDVK